MDAEHVVGVLFCDADSSGTKDKNTGDGGQSSNMTLLARQRFLPFFHSDGQAVALDMATGLALRVARRT